MNWPFVIAITVTHLAMYAFGRWWMRREFIDRAHEFSAREASRAGRYSPTLLRFLRELEGRRK